MPRGPKGEKRPVDVNVRAVMIARIATGGITDPLPRLLYAQRIAGAQ